MSNTKRTAFLKDLFRVLLDKKVIFCVIRGSEGVFKNKESDIDILMNPSDFNVFYALYEELLKRHSGKMFSTSMTGKNYYIRSIFINNEDTEAEGLYIHVSGYITVKSSLKYKQSKINGRRIWVDNIDIIMDNIDGIAVPVPSSEVDLVFILSAYLQKGKIKHLNKISGILKKKQAYASASQSQYFKYLTEVIDDETKGNDNLYKLCNELIINFGKLSNVDFLKQIITILKHNIRYIFRYKGSIIFFSGPDGSGKTTANESLTFFLKKKLQVNIYNSKHLYPISNMFSKQGIKLQAKIRKIDPKDSNTLERDRGHTISWKTRRFLGLLYILAQVYPGYISARYRNWKGQTVIIDTSFFDAYIKGHRPSFSLLQKISVPLIPCGNKWFLMRAEPDVIVARKPELTVNELTFYYNAITSLSKRTTCQIIEINSMKGEHEALIEMLKNIPVSLKE